MAIDATGTPTSLGIPKFNTAVDAPSGKGSNAQMDAIDVLIAAGVSKPAGIAIGEVPVWNGSGWDRSSVTKIGASSLSALSSFAAATVNAANTDVAWPGGDSQLHVVHVTTAGGTVRSLAVPNKGTGTRVIFRNGDNTNPVTIKNNLAGGSGVKFANADGSDLVLNNSATAEYVYDAGTGFWIEVTRNSGLLWQTYTPTLAFSGGGGSLGNGTLAGKYIQIGKTVHCRGILTWGSTTVGGTSGYWMGLPVASNASLPSETPIGTGVAGQTGANAWSSVCISVSETLFAFYEPRSTGVAVWTATTPFTFTTGHTLKWSLTYEAA